MAQIEKYKPEELVEQEGPNKGNISDVELARVGAEVEDKVRSQEVINEIDYQINKKQRLGEYGDKLGYIDREEQKLDRSNPKAENAMKKEVRRRAYEALKEENISHGAKSETMDNAEDAFVKESREKTKQRLKEQVTVKDPLFD
jgi:hypothetical protein